mgnify:CR=1 FL=1
MYKKILILHQSVILILVPGTKTHSYNRLEDILIIYKLFIVYKILDKKNGFPGMNFRGKPFFI